MNLPITQSIFHGELRPNILSDIPFQVLSRKFNNLSGYLPDVENLFISELGKYAIFNFEKSIPLNDIAPDNYTHVIEYTIKPNIDLSFPDPQPTPQLLFYNAIVKAEAKRIKLALYNFSEIVKSDIDTRQEVKETLKQIKSYTKNVADISDLIFQNILAQLIKLYFELTIEFDIILTENDFTPFEDFFLDCYSIYPTNEQSDAYNTAKLIQQAQKYIAEKADIRSLQKFFATICLAVKCNPQNEILVLVASSLENYIYLKSKEKPLPVFEQLTDPDYLNAVFSDTKKEIEEQILPLTNPREIQARLEDIQAEQIKFALGSLQNTIPQQLDKWIKKQIELCETNIAQSFLPVANFERKSTNIKAKKPKTSQAQLKRTAHKRLDFLTGYNRKEEQILKEEDYGRLISYVDDFITNEQVPSNIHLISTYTSIEFLRYTFYLIYKDLNLKTPARSEWVKFLHAVFSQFSKTETDTTSKKFSTKPSFYEDDTQASIKSKR